MIISSTTDILDPETETFSPGPELPIPMHQHCMVQVNETHTFFLYQTSAYMYDWGADSWTELASTLQPRQEAGCGLAAELSEDGETRKNYIIVAGGFDAAVESIRYDIQDDSWSAVFAPIMLRDPTSLVSHRKTFPLLCVACSIFIIIV